MGPESYRITVIAPDGLKNSGMLDSSAMVHAGDYIVLQMDGVAKAAQVVTVIHSSGTAPEVIVKEAGEELELRDKLRRVSFALQN
jgi:hypothetical protein